MVTNKTLAFAFALLCGVTTSSDIFAGRKRRAHNAFLNRTARGTGTTSKHPRRKRGDGGRHIAAKKYIKKATQSASPTAAQPKAAMIDALIANITRQSR